MILQVQPLQSARHTATHLFPLRALPCRTAWLLARVIQHSGSKEPRTEDTLMMMARIVHAARHICGHTYISTHRHPDKPASVHAYINTTCIPYIAYAKGMAYITIITYFACNTHETCKTCNAHRIHDIHTLHEPHASHCMNRIRHTQNKHEQTASLCTTLCHI